LRVDRQVKVDCHVQARDRQARARAAATNLVTTAAPRPATKRDGGGVCAPRPVMTWQWPSASTAVRSDAVSRAAGRLRAFPSPGKPARRQASAARLALAVRALAGALTALLHAAWRRRRLRRTPWTRLRLRCVPHCDAAAAGRACSANPNRGLLCRSVMDWAGVSPQELLVALREVRCAALRRCAGLRTAHRAPLRGLASLKHEAELTRPASRPGGLESEAATAWRCVRRRRCPARARADGRACRLSAQSSSRDSRRPSRAPSGPRA
jgi:hypothetical protein